MMSIKVYQRPLRINNRMKILMDNILAYHSKNGPTNDDHESIIKDGPFLETLLDDPKVSTSLSISEGKDDVASNESILYHKKYKVLFLAIYLGYLSKLVMNKLDGEFEDNWKVKNVVYLISAEKMLLDTTVGHKEKLQTLLVEVDFCDISKKGDMMRVITQGEDILFAVESNLKQDTTIKQCFVVAQLYQSYVHLTLHQIVKASSSEVSESSIVLEDNTVMFENTLDVLCKKLWRFASTNNDFDFCDLHKDCSLKNYPSVLPGLKRSVQIMFRQAMLILDMDKIIHISVSELCSCEIQVCLRNIIDIGLKPIIQDIAENITGAVQNTAMFGYYSVEFILVTGNMFTLMYDSPLYGVYTCMLQSEIEHSLEAKKIDTIWLLVLQNYQNQLLKQAVHEKSYIYDEFRTGNLQRVFSKTYITYIRDFRDQFSGEQASKPFLSFVDKNFKSTNFGGDENTAMILFKAGQSISDTKTIIRLKVEFQNENDLNPNSRFALTLVLARLNHTESIKDKEVISLEEGSYIDEDTFIFYQSYDEPFIQFETKFIPHNSSIQLT
ncbi:uncharacterized protein EV154DRAFT_234836 [Mucor mucedo]|uniref:uncharacterized protein n=1 Tax=Mucor mucedo TaxID=29922 RepID=UPI0022210932|nr:uncharacterized protein EV154DRAFT_234836 [Mucor mucedo]KAI7890894.1 hypothetical protein EV154DRAFT_234836 [Mucor mucedo]